ncbi:hypothetical protein ABH945_004751 [Paraburkholderia sp. GAS333]
MLLHMIDPHPLRKVAYIGNSPPSKPNRAHQHLKNKPHPV